MNQRRISDESATNQRLLYRNQPLLLRSRTLKPGGLVFTEVPLQQRNVVRGEIPGMFHLLFFNRTSFLAMMRSAGFQHVVDVPTPSKGQNDGPLRTLFRRPDRRPNRVGLPGGHA